MNGSPRGQQSSAVPGGTGLSGYVLPTGQYVLRKDRRWLPNGHLVEILSVVKTSLNDADAKTIHVLSYPTTDCSCPVLTIESIRSCSNPRCLATVCRKHWGTCRKCGRGFCSACLTSDEMHGFTVVVCRRCCTPGFVKFLKSLFRRSR